MGKNKTPVVPAEDADSSPAALEGDVIVDEVAIRQVAGDNLLADPVGDGECRVRRVQQCVINRVARAGRSGGQTDDANSRIEPFAFQHPGEQHRIGLGQVNVPEHDGVSVLDILVTADRAVEAEGALKARHYAGGIETGTRLHVVGAQGTLEQLGADVRIRNGPLG